MHKVYYILTLLSFFTRKNCDTVFKHQFDYFYLYRHVLIVISAPGEVSVNVEDERSKPTKLFISWSAPRVVYCPIFQYRIEYKLTQLDQCQDQGNEFEVSVVDNTEKEYTLSELTPFSTYAVVVSAGVDGINDNTVFTPGLVGFGNTTFTDATAPPQNIINHQIEDARSLKFIWEEIPCGDRRGPIVKYNYILEMNSSIVIQTTVVKPSKVIKDLIPCTTYTFIVSGKGPGGQGPFSDGIEARTNAEGSISCLFLRPATH
ncbi:uncharacterized protein LOC117116736 [Anneissia japonica]|uniref:uncharacterized protein LOC117116736 n=1 Tax=Anneissia japonica TaxID=1529436 RepID=UPI0014254DAD|nr:uncharacterized protein LOC117116736 [Anneissia japonica]